MKRFLPLLLLLTLPLAFVSCDEDEPWEEEIMGEYWDGDTFFVLNTNKTGFIEYANGVMVDFGWYASKGYIYFVVPSYGTYECEYRWTREGWLHIFDFFDGEGDLLLEPVRFYRSPKKPAPQQE
ncbi:MAG: hypothetical protein IJS89_02950 [Bacteroidaceae bacterium]|nr:hypothetical protein [Bacteroidaceae bacterium]